MTGSGSSTPIAEDAPPSAQSIYSARKHVRERHRLFYTIHYVPRVSHFDPQSDYHNFWGFFVLFWIGLFIMVVTTVLRNIKDTGYPLRAQVWTLLTANVWAMGLSDLAMVLSTVLVLPIHRFIRRSAGFFRWSRGGMVGVSLFEAGWLFLWIKYVLVHSQTRRTPAKLLTFSPAGPLCCVGPGPPRSFSPSTR